jgi:tetratricopeptide (TPR) repeat protein
MIAISEVNGTTALGSGLCRLTPLAGYFNLGKVFSLQNKVQEAISCFEKVIELSPSIAESYGALSSCYIREMIPESALYWSQKVIPMNEKHRLALMND